MVSIGKAPAVETLSELVKSQIVNLKKLLNQTDTSRKKNLIDKRQNQSIDESHNAKHWFIMAEFQIFSFFFHKNRVDVAQNLQGLSYTKYILLTLPQFVAIG